MDEAVGRMATRASGPPARLTNAERMSLSRSLSSAPPMAITGPAVMMPSGPDAAGSVATLSLTALPATPAKPPHAHNRRRRGALPAVSGKYAGDGDDLASGFRGAGSLFWLFSPIDWLSAAAGVVASGTRRASLRADPAFASGPISASSGCAQS